MKQLTKREKLLIAAIAGVVFLLVNLFLLTRFVKNQSQLRVPPMPCTALPALSANGNFRPDFSTYCAQGID